MAKRKPLVVAFKAAVDGAISQVRQLSRAVTGVGESVEDAERAVGGLGDRTEEETKAAKKAFRSLGIQTEESADRQIAAHNDQIATLRDLRDAGKITAGEFARAFESAEAKIKRVNDRIGRDVRSTQEKIQAHYKKMGASMRSVGGRVTRTASAAAGAGLAAGTAGVVALSDDAFEVRNAANVAGLSDLEGLRQFQRIAAGAKSVGFEVDKVGDILKDFNDRIGDFSATGAGPMVDFFERIGPKVGVTIEDFRKLNSAEALQLYIDSLEKANLSQADFTFFLEAMASDTTALIPLLKNGGAEMKRLADSAEGSGAFYTQEDLDKLQEFRSATAELKLSFRGLGIALVEAGVVDAIVDFIGAIKSMVDWVANKVSPKLLKFGAIFGGIVLVIGPLILALGVVAAIFGTLSAGALAVIGTVGGIAAAVVAAGTAIYVLWDDIKAAFSAGFNWLRGMFGKLTGWMPDWLKTGLLMAIPGGGIIHAARAMGSVEKAEPGPTGTPVNLVLDGQSYETYAPPDVAKALTKNQSLKKSVRPTGMSRAFR